MSAAGEQAADGGESWHARAVPCLGTDRLRLDAHRPDDLDAVAALWGSPETMRYMGRPSPTREECWMRTLRHAGSWALLGYGFWAVRARGTAGLIGEVGFSLFERMLDLPLERLPEAGWVIAPGAYGLGYAREAMHAALDWADRTLDVPATLCMISPDNRPSLRLAERLGYRGEEERAHRGSTVLILRRPRGG